MKRAFWRLSRASKPFHELWGAPQAVNALSTSSTTDIKSILEQKIPETQNELKKIKADLGSKSLGDVTVNMCIGGMRGICGVLWETSLLDPEEGIRFR